MDNVRLDTFRIESPQTVEDAKLTYLTNLGNKVNDPNTSQKPYWKIMNKVTNKGSKIPPLFVNNLFILISSVKARYSNDMFSNRRRPIINKSVLPTLSFLTNKRIEYVNIENEKLFHWCEI